METKILIDQLLEHIQEVIAQQTSEGQRLWEELLKMHPADIAEVCENLKEDDLSALFIKFPKVVQLSVFKELPDVLKEKILQIATEDQKEYLLRHTPLDELTDLFDMLSDKELKDSMEILHKNERQKVLSLLKFPPESAGGIMSIDVITMPQDFTVGQAVSLLQRLKPNIDLHRQVYVTGNTNTLVGYINLEDLVIRSPQTKLSMFLKVVPYAAKVQEDQEEIAKMMVHYHMVTMPVVDENQYLLGVIQNDTLIDVIQQEAIEDVQRMSGAPVNMSYFETSVFQTLYQRGFILGVLLILESITSIIVGRFETILSPFLIMFFAMLVSTGGNTSGQASAITIQALSSGDLHKSNMGKYLRRELFIGLMLAIMLSVISFIRVYVVHKNLIGSFVVSLSLGIIVLLSVLLGSFFPIVLKKIGLDPAFSAGPFLATLMDILGIFVYCYVAYVFLS